jgi:ATP-binding cassette subfamily F protein 3
MSLAVANDLSLAYGPKVLFANASFSIGPHDRIGLIGANGTGKSSLLKLLSGGQSPDTGSVKWRRGVRASYLPQDVASIPDGLLLEVVLGSVPGRTALETRLLATETALGEASDGEEQIELSQALADLHAELDHFEERHGKHQAERILAGLGFTQRDLVRPTRAFSGGWKTRAALAGLLLQDPDLLLLDEPTNHLDVPTLEWFDPFLQGLKKALILVSHDREFLDRQIDRVMSLEVEGLRSYAGNYEDYKRQRAEEVEQLAAKARRQEARRAELQGFIDRFGAKATKARQAQSRKKMLDQMERVEVREERASLRVRFPEAPRSGKEVLRLAGVSKAFGDTVVYRDLTAQVLRGERVAVIGPNGAGKSTLLKLTAGELPPDAGRIDLGHAVVPAYYAQHLFEPAEHGEAGRDRRCGLLDPDRTVLDALWDMVPERGEGFVRNVAGSFLFSGDDVEKKVGVLSGGERARVALARLLLRPANLLIMDEPTNHLDLESSEALIDALKGFQGTLLFVSHNRSFVNQLATKTWEVKGGGIAAWPGNLDDWLYHERQIASEGNPDQTPSPATVGATSSERDRRRVEAEARNARYARERPIRDEIARLEARIDALEQEQKAHEDALAEPGLYEDFARAKPHVEAHRAIKRELDDLYGRWETQQQLLADPG